MNIFRFLGDMSHILSFIILLHKIIKGKSAAGISLRTQEMFLGTQAMASALCARALSCLRVRVACGVARVEHSIPTS